MSLYPSLEDMKVDQMQQAQRQVEQSSAAQQQMTYPAPGYYPPAGAPTDGPPAYDAKGAAGLYPSLGDYMGLDLTPEFIEQNMPVANYTQNMQVAVPQSSAGQMQVAPVTGSNKGLARAEIKQGVKQMQLCKDQNGKIGMRVRHVNNGVFVALVQDNSPAALAGLRFGDQILQINGENVAGWNNDKVHNVFRKASGEKILVAVRERPFERTITLQKDSAGYVGFVYKDGRIKSIVKDSSAARNGLLTDHQLIEVNGQNVVGLKDNLIGDIIEAGGRTTTVTIMPSFLYDHIVKCMGKSIIKSLMDHSIPDL